MPDVPEGDEGGRSASCRGRGKLRDEWGNGGWGYTAVACANVSARAFWGNYGFIRIASHFEVHLAMLSQNFCPGPEGRLRCYNEAVCWCRRCFSSQDNRDKQAFRLLCHWWVIFSMLHFIRISEINDKGVVTNIRCVKQQTCVWCVRLLSVDCFQSLEDDWGTFWTIPEKFLYSLNEQT